MRRAIVVVVGVLVAGSALGVGTAEASHPGSNGSIVFVEHAPSESVPGEWAAEIFVMDPDGSNVRRLTYDGGDLPWIPIGESEAVLSSNHSPAWSPDGNVIAYVHTSTQDVIRLMNPDGRSIGSVTDAFKGVNSLSWSPDGKQLAFLGCHRDELGCEHSIWTIGVDGTNARRVIGRNARDPAVIDRAEWSPTGEWIAFTGYGEPPMPDAGRGVYVVALDGSALRRVECGAWQEAWGPDSFDPEWSPNGESVFCSAGYDGSATGFGIWRTDIADGLTHGPMTDLAGDEFSAVVSPDATVLLFTHWGGGRADLWSLYPEAKVRVRDFQGFHLDWQAIAGRFWDDDHSVFRSDIEWLAAASITRGCNPPSNTKFCPDSHVTRGQMAAFLVRALNLTDTLVNPFTDDDGHTFEADIERLAAAGITKGCNPPVNDMFCPDNKVTREQMAAFLTRAMGYTDDGGGSLFGDTAGSTFETDINRLAVAGVTKGCNPPTNDRFCPKNYVTRGQMAAFLHRALS